MINTHKVLFLYVLTFIVFLTVNCGGGDNYNPYTNTEYGVIDMDGLNNPSDTSGISANTTAIESNDTEIGVLQSSVNVAEGRLGTINFTTYAIGDWDMDASGSAGVYVPLATVPREKITGVLCVIRSDAGIVNSYNLATGPTVGTNPEAWIGTMNESGANLIINIHRKVSGAFDNTSHNQTSYNRGYVTVMHID